MAVIHHTTITPTKLELLADWLPGRPWYRGTGAAPELAKAGGFRLDDPAGAVGIEFMLVSDGAVGYHVPLTYRGAPLAGADDGLLGTAEHGVLGTRWIYDATHDPVMVRALVALLAGEVEAQAQSVSDAPDPTVRVDRVATDVTAEGLTVGAVTHGADATEIALGPEARTLRVHRVLMSDPDPTPVLARVSVPWRRPDGAEQPRAAVASLHRAA